MALATPELVIKWKLRSVVADRKVKVKELADALGVNRVTVSSWMDDKIPAFRDPTSILDGLCRKLKCTPGELIVYEPDEEESDQEEG